MRSYGSHCQITSPQHWVLSLTGWMRCYLESGVRSLSGRTRSRGTPHHWEPVNDVMKTVEGIVDATRTQVPIEQIHLTELLLRDMVFR